jgi:WD40 repeat protein
MSLRHACLSLLACLAFLTGSNARSEPPGRTDACGDPLPEGAVARLGTLRWRGSFLGFTTDGRIVVWKWGDVCLLDAASGKEVRRTPLPPEFVPFALSRDGKLLAAIDWPNPSAPKGKGIVRQTILLWDLATGKEVRRFEGAPCYAAALAFAPDGKTLATRALGSCSVHLWDVNIGKELSRLGGPDPEIFGAKPEERVRASSGLAFSSDGRLLAAADERGQLCVYEVAGGRNLLEKKETSGRINGLAFAPDGKTLAWGNGKDAVCLGAPTGERQPKRLPTGDVPAYGVAFTPDGTLLATADGARGVRFWEVATGKVIRGAAESSLGASSVVFSPDGGSLLASDFGTIAGMDVRTGRIRSSYPGHRGFVHGIAFSPDSCRLASVSDFHDCWVWEAETGKLLRQVTNNRFLYSPVFSTTARYKARPVKGCS